MRRLKLFYRTWPAVFVFLAICLWYNPVAAQKFGYVNTNFILSKMPEYAEAQAEIEKLSQAWQEEIKSMQQQILDMHAELKAEEVLLTPEMKEERLKAIQKKEEQLKEYQAKVFGFEGLFFLKKKELMKPVQDKVYDAVEKVARKHHLAVIFDKSGELVMIYTDPVHDYTDYVLEELGLGDPVDVLDNN
ncbi:MAG TPA: OmpH family outer membrane protein [Flammeovirgaceae bacterium]|nr:OmpH family outer membrane protein [Flammeovirgaceae bacterium]